MAIKYCLDTNIFIEPWNKHYSIKLTPQYWDKISNLIEEGRIFCPSAVFEELIKQDDDLSKWVKLRKEKLVHPITETIQLKVREILKTFPRLINVRKNQSMADPWIIAHALVENAIVVTKESMGFNSDIKIPNVCVAYKLEYIDEIKLATRENLLKI